MFDKRGPQTVTQCVVGVAASCAGSHLGAELSLCVADSWEEKIKLQQS